MEAPTGVPLPRGEGVARARAASGAGGISKTGLLGQSPLKSLPGGPRVAGRGSKRAARRHVGAGAAPPPSQPPSPPSPCDRLGLFRGRAQLVELKTIHPAVGPTRTYVNYIPEGNN